MSKTPSRKPVRIMLWTSARSLSTVFSKAISNIDNSLVFLEPFHTAYLYGPDRKHMTKVDDLPHGLETEYSYENVQRMLEADFPDQDVLCVKDSAVAITGNYDNIPRGFTHIFLIRNPIEIAGKSLGLNKQFMDVSKVAEHSIKDYLAGSPFTDLYNLTEYVETVLGQTPIIIDANDLLANPEGIIRDVCTKVGLLFTDTLLHWEPGVGKNFRLSETKALLNEKTGIYQKAFDSCGFQPSLATTSTEKEIPEIMKMAVSVAMEFYNKMYVKRIQV
ncbi:branched-chain-amino-acid aminotransferase-like protein 2 [Anneissia japonica]|uniref:branched-chain-amino-acid aminotransferase-like protein 2 n=1 Tax=Anneissia japonica TaxID=1529436 RepID=UPI00142559EC|nr:branched-chain-amino-acid aminotransferase-like protein 2 [Anneissia japonica]